MEAIELVRIVRVLFSLALVLLLMLSVAGLISGELKSVYNKLKRPIRAKSRLISEQSVAATKH
jgi:hypothetical protein